MRKEMQLELKAMHRELGITFIYVTHDQEEALTMSDKIVVMSEGKMQQIGTPEDIYNSPPQKRAFNFPVTIPLKILLSPIKSATNALIGSL